MNDHDFRYFKDADGMRHKVPISGEFGEYMHPNRPGVWCKNGNTIMNVTDPRTMKRDGTIETDENGDPIPTVAQLLEEKEELLYALKEVRRTLAGMSMDTEFIDATIERATKP